MNKQQKEEYMKKYKMLKEQGVPFFPDIVFKDAVVWLMVFLLMSALAIFVGVHMEGKANPNDTSYIPRPEWYFLFLYQYLKYWPGSLEPIAATVIPGIAVLFLLFLPFYDTNPKRHPLNRPIATTIMTIIVISMVGLTYLAEVTKVSAPASAAAGQTKAQIIKTGHDLFEKNCASCHGPDGKGVKGVTHLPLNSEDFLNTRTDDVIHNIIAAGQPSVGMQAFGAANGGPLSDEQIDAIITYMRSWQEGGAGKATPTPSAAKKFDPADYYKKNCAVCHGANAEGKGSFPALNKAASEHDMYFNTILNGKGAMPSYKSKLTKDQINQIIDWLAHK